MSKRKASHFSRLALFIGVIISFLYAIATDLTVVSDEAKKQKEDCIVYKHELDYRSYVVNKCWKYTDFEKGSKDD